MPYQSYRDLEDEVNDLTPDDSVAATRATDNLQDLIPSVGAVPPPNPAIAAAIKAKADKKVKSPLTTESDPAIEAAGEIHKDPILQQFDETQNKLDAYRKAKVGADSILNMGQALSGFAQGVN